MPNNVVTPMSIPSDPSKEFPTLDWPGDEEMEVQRDDINVENADEDHQLNQTKVEQQQQGLFNP